MRKLFCKYMFVGKGVELYSGPAMTPVANRCRRENFVYANGHNTEIRLNGTTTVWKLTEENASLKEVAADAEKYKFSYNQLLSGIVGK